MSSYWVNNATALAGRTASNTVLEYERDHEAMYRLSYAQADSLAQEHGDSFYLLDLDRFSDNLQRLRAAFQQRCGRAVIGYSLKTNYIPSFCRVALKDGHLAEVVSGMEYQLARRLGFDANRIVFNGPVKNRDAFFDALNGGALVNLDNLAEVDDLCKALDAGTLVRERLRIGLRVNMDIRDQEGQSVVQNGLRVSRFGFGSADLGQAIDALRAANVEPIALHGHTSTTNRSAGNFSVICSTLCRVRQTHSLDAIEILNVGGGFFGELPPSMMTHAAPSFDDYAEAVAQVFNADPWCRLNQPTIYLEPGVSVVANAVSFYSRIVAVKEIASQGFVTVDGSIYNVRPTMHQLNLPVMHLPADTAQHSNAMGEYDVVGSTCMEKDVLQKSVRLNAPRIGDFVAVENVGAYTVVMTPPFINFQPPIVAYSQSTGMRTSRQVQDVNSFVRDYHWN